MMVFRGILALVLLLNIHFVDPFLVSKPCQSKEVCNTPGCVKAASALIENMDPSVDPCQDFYQFACGGFVEKVKIPDDRSSKSQFGVIDEKLTEQLRDILESEDMPDDSKVVKQAKDHFKACMDLEKLEKIGLEPLHNILNTFGGWPVIKDKWEPARFDWEKMLYQFRDHGYSTDVLFDFSIGTDLKNSTWRTIGFDQPGLGLSREYLIQGLKEENVRHYFDLMKKVAILLGADPAKVDKELEGALNFEIKLAHASLPREERRDAFKLYHPMTLEDLNYLVPLLNWIEYVNKLLPAKLDRVKSTERVIVYNPDYLKNLTNILAAEPKRNIANYMMWKVAISTLGFMNKESRDILEEYAKKRTGKTDETPRWKTCVGSAAGSFSAAVGKMYVKKHFNEDAKANMLEMVKDIKHEFKSILNEIDWMDDETKGLAHEKLQSIKDYIGYPQEILDNAKLEELYDGLEISADSFFLNSINMSMWSTDYVWGKLREEIDKTDWKRHANPAVVNAFYSPLENSIQFPAGILQGIFFGQDRPSYMNYASIGWVIGHEITHGFDDQGRQFNQEGNLQNWWDAKTFEKFLDKTKCIIQQYGNYSVEELDAVLNGITTQGENIADNGGLKEAYRAYDKWVGRHGQEQILPGLSLNQKQLFWLSAANVWCSKFRPKALKTSLKVGSHAPGMFRVRGTFSNSKEFARDFNCPLGSPYNPADKCQVW